MKRVGYWVDLKTVVLSDTGLTWMHAVPLGSYSHPIYGDLNFTPEKIQRMAQNVNNRVRGIDLAVDYDHKVDDKAAGWIKQAEVRQDGLWVGVEWTEPALNALKANEYRYFSPEIADEWENSATPPVKYQDVLFGGGLTNRPYLKDLLPINLSEVYAKEGGTRVDPKLLKALREKYKLAETASEEDVLKALEEDVTKKEPEKEPVALSEEELTKMFGEKAPFVQQLMGTVKMQGDQLSEAAKALAGMQAKIKTSEVDLAITKLTEGGKFAIPPAALDKLKTVMLSEKTDPLALMEIMNEIKVKGLIELGEKGKSRVGDDVNDSAGKTFTEKVTKLLADNKDLDYADAVEIVVAQDPKLFEDYRTESFSVSRDVRGR